MIKEGCQLSDFLKDEKKVSKLTCLDGSNIVYVLDDNMTSYSTKYSISVFDSTGENISETSEIVSSFTPF